MKQQASTPHPSQPWGQLTHPGQFMVTTVMTIMALLVVGSASLGIAFVAFRTRDIPPFDWRVSADKQTSLVVHYGPVCRELPGIPPGACGDYVSDLYELDITYSTPHTYRQWVTALVPLR